jgi:16S rRNA pseudouridine516 synthase
VTKPTTARLDRLLGNLGYGSRKDIQHLASAGLIRLDGAPLRDASRRLVITPDLSERLIIQGKPMDPPPSLTLVMHKPLGVVCSHREPGRSVYELLPVRWRRRDPAISSIGRLDLETSGLLLLTDDGGLLHRVISPKNHIPKRYHVRLARALAGHEAELFAAGSLVLEGDTEALAPAKLEPLGPSEAWLTITEGRYHQVRRMFAATGNHVDALHRDRIGNLDLPVDLAASEYRVLREDELRSVFGADRPATSA